MKNLRNSILTITMAVGLAITGLSPAHASTTVPARDTDSVSISAGTTEALTAGTAQRISYEKPVVNTVAAVISTPAKPVDAPVAAVQPKSSESVPTAAPAVQPKEIVAPPAPALPAPVAPVASFSGSAIVTAALAQLGVRQDCTALVSDSLAAVGIHFHGWPADYMSLGHTVPASAAQPGDLVYYANGGSGMAHIAVYIGGGKAVHGGWEGGNTVIYSVNIGSGPVFIHIG